MLLLRGQTSSNSFLSSSAILKIILTDNRGSPEFFLFVTIFCQSSKCPKPELQGPSFHQSNLFPFFYIFFSFVCPVFPQHRCKLEIGPECCVSIRIFQSSQVDSNRLRTTGYPFPSSLQCKSFSFFFSFYAKARDKVQELEVRKCKAFKARNFPKGHEKRNTLDVLIMCDFFVVAELSFFSLLPEDLDPFVPYFCHFYSLAGAVTQTVMNRRILWIPLGNLILVPL